ncbi:MAG: type II toxin-antitoxin system VapB family antitoxin [Pseudomonadales bacterium]|nr:type II toxin-antitoxin system VapB family antitoxin [Pseudomonadales bacterium]
MALNIKNAEADRLAHELAAATGESITEALTVALRERLSAVRRRNEHARIADEIAALQAFLAKLPDRDTRDPDDILGYDQYGLPR